MNISRSHIIRQQYFHVEVNGTEFDGMALQRSLPDLCQHFLMPALERILNRYAPAESHLIFERIEIDAGTFTLDRLEQDFVESVTQAVEKILQEQSFPLRKKTAVDISDNVQIKTDQQSTQDAFIYFLKTGSLPWSFSLPAGRNLEQAILDSWQDARKSKATVHTLNATIAHAITSEVVRKRLVRQFSPDFMGNLLARLTPENKKVLDGVLTVLQDADIPSIEARQFERQLWKTMFLAVAVGKSQTETSLIGETWRFLAADKLQGAALVNLLEQHWPGVIKNKLIKQAKGIAPGVRERIETKEEQRITSKKKSSIHPNKELGNIGRQLDSKKTSNKEAGKKQQPVKQSLVETSEDKKKKLKDQKQPEPKKTSEQDRFRKTESIKSTKKVSSEISATEKKTIKNSKQSKSKKTTNKSTDQKTRITKQTSPESSVAKKKKGKAVEEQPEADKFDQSDIHTQQEMEQRIYLKNLQNQLDLENDPIDLQQGVYVDCAGLVLLHPFLPRFFEALGIVAEDEILQPDRALCLLHYLATGQTIAPEYELVLPKILCNVTLEMPVESLVELTPVELEEANALLEAVIQHWEVLRNTGVDGLRGTFLVRPGKVSEREDGDWQLQVESKSFDILLDQLPWGISAIKLPWMQRMLWVEWAN